ncbi:MDIS1-interacting receptor like kinase 1-like [Papaver somniferum]|uniref:MDIS1-interacting receptor like kinase 1-like n=1 Tax=Papaver somniferum TaxID=3469 RepID=UPI000E705AD6|nr:MDIS1-interacting receptor like kinase 1-like [Papaver somniferum]
MFEHSWPNLEKLQISSTNATGLILSSNAPQLVSFSASGCSIQGSLVPFLLYHLSRLHYLDLSDNNITSNLSLISNLKNLKFLDLSYNNFQGPIPNSISEILPLRRLVFQSNNITGTLPSCITTLKKLVEFRVSKNSIGGNVSLISLINELNLTTLDLTSNRLTINRDESLHLYAKAKLETLALGSVHLNVFPNFIYNLTHLKYLILSDTNLKGAIPSCISKLQNLVSLDLSNNKIIGPLPLPPQGVYDLNSSHNKLSGEISLEAGERLSSAKYINLSGNQLSGSIPSSICSQELRKYYDPNLINLSNNKLSGNIPTSIGYCRSLTVLNLSNNNLTGNIPNEIQRAEGLEYLQLSYNNLNGTFPKPIDKFCTCEVST